MSESYEDYRAKKRAEFLKRPVEEQRATILGRFGDDLICDVLYYDLKEDEMLPVGAIEAALKAGTISFADIMEAFGAALKEALGVCACGKVYSSISPAENGVGTCSCTEGGCGDACSCR